MAADAGRPTLLHLSDSQSQTILWLLEELDIPYDVKLFEREKGRAPAALKETHPLGKSPQLITASGRVIIERSAITAYLIDTYDTAGKFKISGADDKHDKLHEQELLGFAQSSYYVIVMLATILHVAKVMSPFFVRPIIAATSAILNIGFVKKELDLQLTFLNDQLAGQGYFLSQENPTRIDFVMLYFIDLPYARKVIDLAPYPTLKAWLERCLARPAWKRALKKGNSYKLA